MMMWSHRWHFIDRSIYRTSGGVKLSDVQSCRYIGLQLFRAFINAVEYNRVRTVCVRIHQWVTIRPNGRLSWATGPVRTGVSLLDGQTDAQENQHGVTYMARPIWKRTLTAHNKNNNNKQNHNFQRWNGAAPYYGGNMVCRFYFPIYSNVIGHLYLFCFLLFNFHLYICNKSEKNNSFYYERI